MQVGTGCGSMSTLPASIYLLKVNNRNTRTINMFKVNNKDNSTTQLTSRRSGVFLVNFEDISHLVLVFLLLTLNMLMWAGM